MKILAISLLTGLFIVASGTTARADIEVIIVSLRADEVGLPNTWIVPSGKIFVIEWAVMDHLEDGVAELHLPGGGRINLVQFYNLERGNASPKLPEGNVIIATSGMVHFGGLLVDLEDIYAAAVPSEFKQTGVAAGQLAATLKQSSPRPTVVKVETSTDLQTWTPDPTATVANTSDKTEKQVTVAATTPRKFVRAKVISRAKE